MKLFCQTYSFGKLEEHYQPPIIFLHGMALSGNMFKHVAPTIAKMTNRKAYVPDLRNHGRSPWAKEMNYDVLTNDVLKLMKQNNIQKAIIVGNSMGGRIAMNLALKYPHKVDALVIEDMTPRNIVSSGVNVLSAVEKMAQEILDSYPPDTELNKAKMDIFETILNFVPHLYDKSKTWRYDPDYIPIVKEGDRFKLECNVGIVREMLENNTLVQNLPDLGATFNDNALFLYGSKGFFNLGRDPSIKKLFPKAIIIRIENASHFIHADSPEEYTNSITDFLLHRNLPQSKY